MVVKPTSVDGLTEATKPTGSSLLRPEGVYAVANLRLSTCPWCRKPAEQCVLLAYERGEATEFKVMCERCSAAAAPFVQMRRDGLSRRQVLEDFGFRGPNAQRPE